MNGSVCLLGSDIERLEHLTWSDSYLSSIITLEAWSYCICFPLNTKKKSISDTKQNDNMYSSRLLLFIYFDHFVLNCWHGLLIALYSSTRCSFDSVMAISSLWLQCLHMGYVCSKIYVFAGIYSGLWWLSSLYALEGLVWAWRRHALTWYYSTASRRDCWLQR